MDNNNYKAPESSLLDLPEPALPERPRNVNIALCLIGGGVLIQMLAALKALQDAYFQIPQFWPWSVYLGRFVLFGVICHQISHGKSWARLLLLLFTLIVFAQVCWFIGFAWRGSPETWDTLVQPEYLLTVFLPLAMNIAALHLLFFSSGDWFRSR